MPGKNSAWKTLEKVSTPPWRYRLVFPVIAVLFGVILTLLVAEVSIRLLLPPSRWRFRDPSENFAQDREIGWVQRSNLNVAVDQGEFGWTATVQTNPDGLLPAGASRPKAPGDRRVMIFGDSTAVGRLVPEDKRIHSQLQALLSPGGARVEVINAGVEGYSTDQELLLMKRLVPLYRPDVVLLVVCENDLPANITSVAYGIPKPRFLFSDGTIAGIELPILRANGIQTTQVSLLRRVLRNSALYRVFVPYIFAFRSRFLDMSNLNLMVELPEAFYYRSDSVDNTQFRILETLVREMKLLCDRNGARFLMYDHPSLNETWDPYIASIEKKLRGSEKYDRYALEKKIKQIADRNAIEFCPLIDYFARNQSRGPFHLLPRDPHCNPAGYQLTAEALAECLRRDPPRGD